MREREFNLVAGSPGAGKSTFVAEYSKQYRENVWLFKHKANIDDPAFGFLTVKTLQSWRQGAAPGQPVKCKIAGDKKTYKAFLQAFLPERSPLRNGLLVIDDATIFERDRLTEEMNELVTMRRHYGIDIWLVYHGLTLLPIEQFIFTNHVILFNTNDNINYKASKLPAYQQLLAAVNQARVNFQSTDKRVKHTPAIVKLA